MSSLPDDPALPERLGDYELLELLGETPRTRSFRAHQVSVDREVVVEALRPELLDDAAQVEEFLADVRVKGAVEHPAIGSVYEAVRADGAVFYAREALPGESLDSLRESRERLGPRRLLPLLRQVGELMLFLEEQGIATAPLEPRHLVVGDRGVLRMVNRAVGGERTDEMQWRDREAVADAFRRILSQTRPGSTRVGKLLDYLRVRGEDAVSWRQVIDAGDDLLGSLESSPVTRSLDGPSRRSPSPAQRGTTVVLILAVLCLVGGVAYLATRPAKETVSAKPPVEVPAGSYPGPGGTEVSTDRIWVAAGEVTIAEYAKFLRALDLIGPETNHVFDHPDQPAEKNGHVPDAWEAMLAAADTGGTWQGRPISRDHPVVNVDWWDAYAYANWKDGRLPTLAEWFAAWQGANPPVSDWGPAYASGADFAKGIHGLAGNVAEWARDPEVNPAFPMNPKAPVICGGSFQSPDQLRRWVESRDFRAPDVGFRVVFDQDPSLP